MPTFSADPNLFIHEFYNICITCIKDTSLLIYIYIYIYIYREREREREREKHGNDMNIYLAIVHWHSLCDVSICVKYQAVIETNYHVPLCYDTSH